MAHTHTPLLPGVHAHTPLLVGAHAHTLQLVGAHAHTLQLVGANAHPLLVGAHTHTPLLVGAHAHTLLLVGAHAHTLLPRTRACTFSPLTHFLSPPLVFPSVAYMLHTTHSLKPPCPLATPMLPAYPPSSLSCRLPAVRRPAGAPVGC